eukprot:scaffold39126_cov66-Phaeocystis_antarctica.AAC.7
MNENGSWHSQPDFVQIWVLVVHCGSSAHTSARRTRMAPRGRRATPPRRATREQSKGTYIRK